MRQAQAREAQWRDRDHGGGRQRLPPRRRAAAFLSARGIRGSPRRRHRRTLRARPPARRGALHRQAIRRAMRLRPARSGRQRAGIPSPDRCQSVSRSRRRRSERRPGESQRAPSRDASRPTRSAGMGSPCSRARAATRRPHTGRACASRPRPTTANATGTTTAHANSNRKKTERGRVELPICDLDEHERRAPDQREHGDHHGFPTSHRLFLTQRGRVM